MTRREISKLRRYEFDEILKNDSIKSFGELQSKQHSLNNYDGNNSNCDSSNIFKVRPDGEMSVTTDGKCIYVERWNKSLDNPGRVIKLPHHIQTNIVLIEADFDRGFVISGDERGKLIIQNMFTNQILFKNTQFFQTSSYPITCSSIMGAYLCIGNNGRKIGTINLKTFSRINKLSFNYDEVVCSLNICRIKNKPFVIAAGGKYFLYSFTYFYLSVNIICDLYNNYDREH